MRLRWPWQRTRPIVAHTVEGLVHVVKQHGGSLPDLISIIDQMARADAPYQRRMHAAIGKSILRHRRKLAKRPRVYVWPGAGTFTVSVHPKRWY